MSQRKKTMVLEMPRRYAANVQPPDPQGPNPAEARRAIAVSLEVIGSTITVAARRAGVGINAAVDLYVEHSLNARNRAYQEGFSAGNRSLLTLRRAA